MTADQIIARTRKVKCCTKQLPYITCFDVRCWHCGAVLIVKQVHIPVGPPPRSTVVRDPWVYEQNPLEAKRFEEK